MNDFIWHALPALWPSFAAVLLLALALAARRPSTHSVRLGALAVWAASIGAYELGIGQESSVSLLAAPASYVAVWLLVTAIPIVAVVSTFTLLRERSVPARAGLAALVGLVAVLPMPALMLATSCFSGKCL